MVMEPPEDDFKKMMQAFQQGFMQVASTNQKVAQILGETFKGNGRNTSEISQVKSKVPLPQNL